MRAVGFKRTGGPDVLELISLERAECRKGEVRILVHAASVNPVDCKVRTGALPPFGAHHPHVTGRDGSGRIVEAGADVDPDLVGRRVCFVAPPGVGTWADEIVLPANLAAHLPDAVSHVDGAGLGLAGLSAWAGLVQAATIGPGSTVLVHGGAGGVGGIAIQLAKVLGAVVAATCSRRNESYVRSLGADEVFPYDATRFEDHCANLDVVFDLIGGEVHRRSLPVLRKGGTLVYLNAAPIEPPEASSTVSVRNARVTAGGDGLAALAEMMARGGLRSTVDRAFPFSAFREAHEAAESRAGRGKIVLQLVA